jgi:DNA-directed RNA polymerase II subunit RPB1
MARVHDHCKGKMVCEQTEAADEEMDGAPGSGSEPKKKGHGGCGHVQPLIRREGLKLYLVYKKVKDDEDTVPISAIL